MWISVQEAGLLSGMNLVGRVESNFQPWATYKINHMNSIRRYLHQNCGFPRFHLNNSNIILSTEGDMGNRSIRLQPRAGGGGGGRESQEAKQNPQCSLKCDSWERTCMLPSTDYSCSLRLVSFCFSFEIQKLRQSYNPAVCKSFSRYTSDS